MPPITNINPIETISFLKKAVNKTGEFTKRQLHHAAFQGITWIAIESTSPSHDWQSLLINKLKIDAAEILETFFAKKFRLIKKSRINENQKCTNTFSLIFDGAIFAKRIPKKIKRNLKKVTKDVTMINAMYQDERQRIKSLDLVK